MSEEKLFGNELKYPFEFMGFTVYERHSVCNTCGTSVVGGIIQKANHWDSCAGDGYVDALKGIFEDKQKVGETVNSGDIDKLNDKFNFK